MWKSAATNWLLLSIASICFAQDVDKSKGGPSSGYKVIVPPESLELDSFYEKYVNASGYPIVASGKVNDYALKEAAYIVDLMLGKRPDLRDAMLKAGSRLVVMSHKELTTDIPEHNHLKPKDYWDRRAQDLKAQERAA